MAILINVKTNPNVAFFIIQDHSVNNGTIHEIDLELLDESDLIEVKEALEYGILIGFDPNTAGTLMKVYARIDFLNGVLGNVEITNPIQGQVLKYDGTKWKNESITNSNLYYAIVDYYSDLPDPALFDGYFFYVKYPQGTKWLPGTLGGTYRKPGSYYAASGQWLTDLIPNQASQDDVNTGAIDDQFITPKTFNNAHKWTTRAPLNNNGVVDIEFGGTSANNKNDAFNNLAPDQNGLNGGLLTTDGQNTQWSLELSGGNF